MSPKLRSVLARVVLVGGAVFVLTYLGKTAPHDQTVAVRLNGRDVTRIQGIVTKLGDSEPTAGFSQNFSPSMPAPRVVRHAFSAPNGTYIVVINCTEESPAPEEDPSAAGAAGAVPNTNAAKTNAAKASPKLIETSFERRVSLAGGEVILSPD